MAIGDPIPNVADNTLILTTWGNAVKDEINSNVVKRTTGANQVLTGALIITGSPALKLRHGTAPFLQFENSSGTSFGHIQATTSTMEYDAKSASHLFKIDGTTRATLTASGLVLPGSVNANAGVFGRADDFDQLQIIDQAGTGVTTGNAFIAFYPSGTTSATGARGAYVGYHGEGFQVQTDSGNATFQGAGHVFVRAGTSGVVAFENGGAEHMRLQTSTLLIGKIVSDLDVTGAEIVSTGQAANGQYRSTISNAGQANMYCRRTSTANADNQVFIDFTVGTGGADMFSGSDYRLKDDHGPIPDAVERVRLLQPKRMLWKGDPPENEFDGFIAHEVAPAAPYAVRGDKDAVLPPDDPYDPGGIDAQVISKDSLVPLLTAALQQALTTIDDLTARVDALEAAAA